MKLILSGYKSISIDAAVLESAARIDQWQPGRALSKVLAILRGPNTESRSAIAVAAEFIRSIWLNAVLSPRRIALLMAVLDVLVTGRPRARVLQDLRARLEGVLELLPLARDEVFKVIAGWERMGVIELVR